MFSLPATAVSFMNFSDMTCTTMVPHSLAPVCEFIDKRDFVNKLGMDAPIFNLTEEQFAQLVQAGTIFLVGVSGTIMVAVRFATYLIPRFLIPRPDNETVTLQIISKLATALAARGPVANLPPMPGVLPRAEAIPMPGVVTPNHAPAPATPPTGRGMSNKFCRYCTFTGIVASALKICPNCYNSDALRPRRISA